MSQLSQLTPSGPSDLFTRNFGVKRVREEEYDYNPNTAPPKLRRTMAKTYSRPTRRFVKRYSSAKRSNRPQAGRPELKFRDATVTDTAITSSGAVMGVVNPLGQGTGQQNRIGTKVRTEYISIKGNIMVGPSGQGNIHVMLVLDRQPNGALPTFNQIFNSYSTGQFMRNIGDNPKRFLTLATQSFSVSLGGNDMFNLNMYVPGNRLKGRDRYTYYNASNTNSITDISTNSIIILALSSESLGNAPTLNIFSRYRFKDE